VTLDALKFDERGLLPVVVRERPTGAVSMLAWANREALERTISTGQATFWSRSRGILWIKGETSGHRMEVLSVVADCDGDAVLYEVRLSGPACHTGQASCFHRVLSGVSEEPSPENFDLAPLFAILKSRQRERPAGSYSTQLFEKGLDHILKKVGEEASEVIVAMKNSDDEALAGEVADLLYHLAAAMTERGLPPAAVNETLARRRKPER
jgi:phosphoribosyl-ATP pyrophosphohydrolase/phosphoribosyl-AMP cyclohydrolase